MIGSEKSGTLRASKNEVEQHLKEVHNDECKGLALGIWQNWTRQWIWDADRCKGANMEGCPGCSEKGEISISSWTEWYPIQSLQEISKALEDSFATIEESVKEKSIIIELEESRGMLCNERERLPIRQAVSYHIAA